MLHPNNYEIYPVVTLLETAKIEELILWLKNLPLPENEMQLKTFQIIMEKAIEWIGSNINAIEMNDVAFFDQYEFLVKAVLVPGQKLYFAVSLNPMILDFVRATNAFIALMQAKHNKLVTVSENRSGNVIQFKPRAR